MSELVPWTGGRMCVVMMSALGDAVHVLPLLDAIKCKAPATHLTWILQPGPAELVRGHPHVDDIILFHRTKGFAAYREVRRELRKRAPFDLVLNLQVYFKAGIVTWLTQAPVKLGFDRARARDLNWLFTTHKIPPHAPQHVQDQYFEFLDAIGVPHGEPQWNLAPTDADRARARELLVGLEGGPLVGLVVATSKPAKNWPPERFAELADRLTAEHGARVVLLGGNSQIERDAAAVIERLAISKPRNLLGSGLKPLLGLLEACKVVVSSDTGPYHMCVAMNVPAVGLFGYTNPKRVGPYNRFKDLLIDAYGDPGEDYPISMEYRYNRMARITVDEVVARAGQVLIALRSE